MLKIYAAGPMTGLSVADIKARYQRVMNDLDDTFKVFHPMIDHQNFETTTRDPNHKVGANTAPKQTQRSFFGRDKWMVQQCDILLADFSQATVTSIGTCFEIAWAHILGKYVVSIMPDGNPHEHAFIYMASDTIFQDYESAIEYLKKLSTSSF